MRTKTMLDCIKLSVFFTVVLGLALAVVFYATITFGQEIVPTAASAQESAMRVGTPPAYPNMNKHAAVEEDEEEAAPFLSRQGGYRMADFMNSESLPGLDYSSNRWLHTRRIQSLSEPKSSFSVARVAMQSSPVAMARDYGHIFSEARTEIDNFNLRASKIEMDLAVVEKVHYIYEKTDYLKKEISPDDPDVQEMIEKAKDDIIERFDLDENERDKIKVVRIEPGWSIYPYPEPLDFLYINEDLLLSDGVKTVWNEKDRVYNTVDSDVGLTFSCLGCGEATEALGTTRSENDATARITSKDPSSLVRDILSGGVPASAGDSTGMDKLSGSTCYATEGASLLGMDNDLTSSYAVRRIPSIIRPIIRPIPFYDYKIVFAYTADEEDPNRTEMELEYLVAKNEVRISMATTKVYGNGRLKREICNSYDWSGNIVKMSLTTFKYNQDGSLKKATSVLLDRDFRKYAEIVISYKYHANGEVKIKKIKRDDFDRNEELICSTISKYEYNEDGQIVYHVEKYKNAQEPGYAVTMEETYEYDRGRLVRVTRKHYDHNHALYSKCVETYEYHGNGNSKNKTVETSYYRDGAVYYRYVNNYVYNKK